MQKELERLIITIPTYKRKNPSILYLINEETDLTFYMFVRKNDYEDGYYDEPQFRLPNLKFVPIEGVSELGLTREKMLQYAVSNGYKYNLQIDDSQLGIQDIHNEFQSLSEMLTECVDRFETDPLKEFAVIHNFSRKVYDCSVDRTYFKTQCNATFLINADVCKQHNLHFDSCKECGLEDLTFLCKAIDKGLVMLSNNRFLKVGKEAFTNKSSEKTGGCHTQEEYQLLGQNIKSYNDAVQYKQSTCYQYLQDCLEHPNLIIKLTSIRNPGTTYVRFNYSYAYDLTVKSRGLL